MEGTYWIGEQVDWYVLKATRIIILSKVLWSHVGHLNNPQAKIISIPMQYIGAAVHEKISLPLATNLMDIRSKCEDEETAAQVVIPIAS